MAGGMTRMYGAATMVGKDERNGRINPALEADDDLPVVEAKRQMEQEKLLQQQQFPGVGGGGGVFQNDGSVVPGIQAHTAFWNRMQQ